MDFDILSYSSSSKKNQNEISVSGFEPDLVIKLPAENKGGVTEKFIKVSNQSLLKWFRSNPAINIEANASFQWCCTIMKFLHDPLNYLQYFFFY